MKLHEKVKFYRELKRFSQENIAFDLGLNQSQYSRRESGAIKFNVEEIDKLSKILDVSANELFGDETIVFNNVDQNRNTYVGFFFLVCLKGIRIGFIKMHGVWSLMF